MRKVLNINSKWSFRQGVSTVPAGIPSDWDVVNLPHTWNAIDGQDGGNDYYRGTCMYVKVLDREEIPTADRYYLEIKGANSSAYVYINGKSLRAMTAGIPLSVWRLAINLKKAHKLPLL